MGDLITQKDFKEITPDPNIGPGKNIEDNPSEGSLPGRKVTHIKDHQSTSTLPKLLIDIGRQIEEKLNSFGRFVLNLLNIKPKEKNNFSASFDAPTVGESNKLNESLPTYEYPNGPHAAFDQVFNSKETVFRVEKGRVVASFEQEGKGMGPPEVRDSSGNTEMIPLKKIFDVDVEKLLEEVNIQPNLLTSGLNPREIETYNRYVDFAQENKNKLSDVAIHRQKIDPKEGPVRQLDYAFHHLDIKSLRVETVKIFDKNSKSMQQVKHVFGKIEDPETSEPYELDITEFYRRAESHLVEDQWEPTAKYNPSLPRDQLLYDNHQQYFIFCVNHGVKPDGQKSK